MLANFEKSIFISRERYETDLYLNILICESLIT
jgi:hypothetical protein